jgi:hypothetical protein
MVTYAVHYTIISIIAHALFVHQRSMHKSYTPTRSVDIVAISPPQPTPSQPALPPRTPCLFTVRCRSADEAPSVDASGHHGNAKGKIRKGREKQDSRCHRSRKADESRVSYHTRRRTRIASVHRHHQTKKQRNSSAAFRQENHNQSVSQSVSPTLASSYFGHSVVGSPPLPSLLQHYALPGGPPIFSRISSMSMPPTSGPMAVWLISAPHWSSSGSSGSASQSSF